MKLDQKFLMLISILKNIIYAYTRALVFIILITSIVIKKLILLQNNNLILSQILSIKNFKFKTIKGFYESKKR